MSKMTNKNETYYYNQVIGELRKMIDKMNDENDKYCDDKELSCGGFYRYYMLCESPYSDDNLEGGLLDWRKYNNFSDEIDKLFK
jgi:hypothetical protein